MSDDISIKAMEEARSRAEMRWILAQIERLRAEGRDYTTDPDLCPACTRGLKKRAFPDQGITQYICMHCAWTTQREFIPDDARELFEEHIPGVTGRTRGKVVVRMDAGGRILDVDGA